MSTTKIIEKNQTKFNIGILTCSNQDYQSNNIFKDTSEMVIITVFYLIFRMFSKIKMNFDINLRISGRNKKLKH